MTPEAASFERLARRRVAPLAAAARAWLERSEPGTPSHAAAQAAYSEYAALRIRAEIRLGEWAAR